MIPNVGALLVLSFLASAPPPVQELRAELEAAARRYDTEEVLTLLSRVRATRQEFPDPGLASLQVDAGLLAAELLRIEYEEGGDRRRRRLLGQRIDAIANEALGMLEKLPESSERERRRADLIATLIRSDFRAKRHEGTLRSAVARALELDESNPRAWVSAAKPYLFAKAKHGGDVEEAARLLSHALELAPSLESARLLRAHAYEKLGRLPLARRDWRAALDRNADCRPARRALASGSQP